MKRRYAARGPAEDKATATTEYQPVSTHMPIPIEIHPSRQQRVMDLVALAGVDVSAWAGGYLSSAKTDPFLQWVSFR